MKHIEKGIYIFLLSVLIPMLVFGQKAEYNSVNNWIYPTAQKFVGMDFVNTSKGTLINNGTIIYGKNFTNNGKVDYVSTLAKNPALSEFVGASLQHISGNGVTRFYSLMFASKLLANAFSLEQNISVSKQVDFTNGIIVAKQTTLETEENLLLMEANASATNVSDNSYIDGFVSKEGNSNFTFPIGNGGFYRPISTTPSTSSIVKARYCFLNPDQMGYTRSSKVPSIWRVSDKEYWLVKCNTDNVQLTLSWDTDKTSARIPTDLRYLSIVRWDGTKWVDEGNTSTTGNSTQGTITAIVSGYGVFSLAMQTKALPIAQIDEVTVYEDNSITVDALANDVCNNGGVIIFNKFSINGTDYKAGETVSLPDIGTIVSTAKGVFTFTPVLNYSGSLPDISYSISDVDDNRATGKVMIKVMPMPEVIKSSNLPIINSDGSFSIKYKIKITNDTPNDLTSVQIEDNLDAVFNPKNCTYIVTSIIASGGLTANGLYNGSNIVNTLNADGKLLTGQTDSLEIEVSVNTWGQKEILSVSNQAVFTAQTPFGIISLKSDADVATAISEPTQTDIPVSVVTPTEGFSPNGDGVNDYYVIAHDESTKIIMDIYNRSGYIIYHSSDYKNDWDGSGTGSHAGEYIPDGTYWCSYKAVKLSTGEIVSSATAQITLHRAN